jgi:hypothetical protein
MATEQIRKRLVPLTTSRYRNGGQGFVPRHGSATGGHPRADEAENRGDRAGAGEPTFRFW